MIPYEVIYSKRKTLALQITREGKVYVRAPEAEKIYRECIRWLREHPG